MKNKLILHVPHSSTKLPNKLGFLVEAAFLEKEILKLTDWYTDDLFRMDDSIVVKADFSRIFCDVERFADDSKEPMAQVGMGVIYQRTDDDLRLREVSQELRLEILNDFYWPHHNKLNRAVESQLKSVGKAVIVDCHSFPKVPLKKALDQTINRPDFNIGTDKFHTPNYLIELSEEFFKKKGFSVGLDWPYSGSIVPIKHYQQSKNVESIMLEVNRALYLSDDGNQKSSDYLEIKQVVSEYLKTIKTTF
jgi:N-formylglutamate amidohydrolase